jgi:Sulfotransferase family
VNPYLFIVGCARSGTTLLRRMVDAHPLIAIPREQHWLPKWFERRKGVTSEGFVTPELVSELIRYEKFVRMRIGREELERLLGSGDPVKYSDFVSGVFDLYGQAQGKSLVGDKTPAYVDRIPTLHALWPNARFVHLVRDGRNVCLSTINWGRAFKIARRFTRWDEDAVTTTALWWERKVRLGHEDGTPLGPELYHEVRYEELVSEPAKTCAALCGFLDIPYDEAMLKFHEGRTKTKPGLDAKGAWLPVTPGLRDWRTQMPTEDLERFEATVGDLLDELGYPRAFPDPSPQALDHTQRIRDFFTQDVRERGDRLPVGWER